MFACGEGASGRLGVGGYLNIQSPRQITGLSTYVVRKVAVHSGGQHALALTADGKVFSWGAVHSPGQHALALTADGR